MSQLGIGVMIKMLAENGGVSWGAVKAAENALGKTISGAKLENDALLLQFTDDSSLELTDTGQSCCERRYMSTDDTLCEYAGATLLDLEVADAPGINDGYDCHEVQFLRVKTDKGTFVMANHNEHNGYYGGFWLTASYKPPTVSDP